MNGMQRPLAAGLLAAALTVMAFFATAVATGPVDRLFGDAPGLGLAREIALLAAILASAALLAAGAVLTLPLAFSPAPWGRKLANALPSYLLGLTLAGVVLHLGGIGTVGGIVDLPLVGELTFARTWMAVSAALATLAVVATALRAGSDTGRIDVAASALRLVAIASVVAWLGTATTAAIVTASEPSTPSSGGPPGTPGAAVRSGGAAQPGQAAPSRPGAPGETGGSGEAGASSASGASGGPADPASASGPAGPGAAAGPRAPGGSGGPGGPGEPGGPDGPEAIVRRLQLGAGVLAVLVLLTWATASAARRSGTSLAAARPAPVEPPGEARRTVLAWAALAAITLFVSQLVPVTRDNPPVRTALAWDVPETEALWDRACGECHSNETTWPWYSGIAPSSWLLAGHVHAARDGLNFSEFDEIPEDRLGRLPERLARIIHNGGMPPNDFLLMHPEARLTEAEKEQLIGGLEKTLAAQAR